jgi:hypothetical protein
MKVTHLFMSLATADHDTALGWYTRLFGRGPDAGMRTAVVVDPDGNSVKFFEDPGA